jgi:oxygen-independent coproporphyrinogen-3 oxidase
VPSASLYLHIPFCKTRCSYCAFNTYAGLEHLLEPYIAALQQELVLVGGRGTIYRAPTIYFGGGTPSLLSPEQLETLLTTCRERFELPSGAEISIEANPGTVDLEKLRGYKMAGVTRLSLGVQSAQAAELALFNRSHTYEEAFQAFQTARRAGYDNVGIDLIYGAPQQTLESWRDTLDRILGWEPEHISLYSLTVEKCTPLHKRIGQGKLDAPDSDLTADMYDAARERMARADLCQYELSNWARPGYECRHNRQYWLNEPYLGFGAGAYGTISGIRYWNVKAVGEYIERAKQGDGHRFPPSLAVEGFETIDEKLAMIETMILGLRLTREGMQRERFARRFGRPVDEVFGSVISDLVGLGLLVDDGQTLRLTERAYLISNQVFVRFLEL